MQVEDPDSLLTPVRGTDKLELLSDDGYSFESGGEGSGPLHVSVENLSGSRSSAWRSTPQLALLVGVAASGGLSFGYDTSAIGGAMLFLEAELQANGIAPLSPFMQGLIPAATPFAAVVGALLGGLLFPDKYGRKVTIMLACVIFVLGSAMMAFTPNVTWFLVLGRIAVGLGVGLTSMVVPTFLAESAPEAIRGAVVTVFILFVTVGQFAAYALNNLLCTSTFNWRWTLGLSAVPATLQFVGMLFVAESPRWLVAQGQLGEAKRALTAIRGDAAVASRDLRDICVAVKNEPKGSLRELMAEGANRRALMIACGVLVLQQLCAINTVMYYMPSILQDVLKLQQACGQHDPACNLRADCQISLWSMLPAGANALGTVVGLFCVDRFGRRPLLIASLLSVAVSLVGFGLVYTFAPPLASVALLVVYLLCFSPGLGPVPWALTAEIFAIKVRMMGVSIATACNWLSNGVISVTFPPLVAKLGLASAFYLYALFAIASLVFVFLIVPETKQKTLEQVQSMLKEQPYPTKYFGSKRRIRL